MKNKKKWVAILTALVCMVPLLAGVLGGGDSAHAADSVNVTLHKKKMDEFPNSSLENTGKEMSEFDRYEGFQGVTFSAWDITEDFYSELDATLDGTETDAEYNAKAKLIMDQFDLTNAANATKVGSDQTTDANGEANFANLPAKNADGSYKVYYFEEHAQTGVVIGSYKLILMLPMKDGNTELTNIHLYPKNKVETEKPKKELVDENGDPLPPRPNGAYDFEVGQEIYYRATFQIPSQIGDILPNGTPRYSKLAFSDAVDQTGVKFEEISQITMNGTPINAAEFLGAPYATTTYTNDGADFSGYAGFDVAMNLTGTAGAATANYLSQYAGKMMTIYYTVSFTEETPVDLDINNEFTVTMNHDGGSDEVKTNDPVVPPITTGGKKFFKYTDGSSKEALPGAEFVVIREINGVDHYLTADATSMTWTAVGANEDYATATKYVSGADGRFQVTGLEYGTYYLRETKAPNGYSKLQNDVEFTVAKGSFNAAAQEIENVTKGGLLPSTGGMGIIAFIVIGLGLMGAAIVRYRRVQFEA
ncbi:SpaH/EbpB family LPXTG-anchored major pilin [Enterococcus gilvus]|uniref:SpaH/EbpB family LPXTG-anchored major pilin n=1 Tax=Enterococcus gilvus TaxID=160453 RepID=UPI002909AB60|nr:SpaH/EbpB family LPXTG-anchored major pilin [Enterococcus gilvus]MDU5509097.1 SpaH/EbpB family LPXTG-anchored major pilin [Enterococcus gilvus]